MGRGGKGWSSGPRIKQNLLHPLQDSVTGTRAISMAASLQRRTGQMGGGKEREREGAGTRLFSVRGMRGSALN